MRRFVYAPDVNAYILTDSGLIDVSADIISGSVTRRINAVSNAQLTLQNPNRKYLRKQTVSGQKLEEQGDLLFKPMDRIVIYLTRVKSIPVFSGYIDRAPYDQLYPGPVNITASCTLKRLMYTFWDPGLPFVMQWMAKYGWVWNPLDSTVIDSKGQSLFNSDFSGGLGFMLHQILNEVGGWPAGENGRPNSIHILELPDEFLAKTQTILQTQIAESTQEEADIAELIKTLITPEGIISDLNPNGQNTLTAKSAYTNTNPIPGSSAGDYPAKIFGEAITPGGIGVAGQVAATFEARGIPARLGVATAWAESTLRPDAANSIQAVGLFQYYSKSGLPHQAEADAARAYARTHWDGKSTAPGLSNVYPAVHQIEDAATWFISAKPSGSLNANNINDMARWCERAQVSGTYFVNGQATAYFKQAWEKAGTLLGQQASGPKQGVIGDVHTNVAKLFDSNKNGYTFTAKKNPFGDDSLIFKAKYDGNTPSGMVSFYVPGADNKAPPWASEWQNHSVTVAAAGDQTAANPANQTNQTDSTSTAPTASKADQIVKIAIGQIGVREVDHTNTGPQVNQYLIYAGSSPGQPWCAAFVSWVYGKAGVTTVKTAGAAALESTGTNSNKPAPGMIATFRTNDGTPDNDHAGIVVRVSGDQFWTVEGNHGNGVGPGGPYNVADAAVKVTAVPGIGVSAGANQDGVLDGTGVMGLDITDFTASSAAGYALGFPAVADISESILLTGKRAMANDVALLEWVEFIVKASGRNFMSTPRGDFIAFYPDYFNWTGEAPYFTISGIETINLSIDVGDEELTTHVFTTGDTIPETTTAIPTELIEKLHSTVASVEETETFQTLVNSPSFDVTKFLQRYGARPYSESRPEIKHPLLQFMYGWMLFLERWAKQFYCEAEFTFMPELIPGGLVDFYDHDLIMYIQEVTHNFDRGTGFTTTASLIAPSTRGGSNPAMVLTGGPADTITANPNPRAINPSVSGSPIRGVSQQ
jgi:uncharacterized protein (TIGR02594 family)